MEAKVSFDRVQIEREGVVLRGQRTWTGAPRPADLILVHGLMSRGTNWQGVADRLARAGWSVLAPDARGHGLSGCPEARAENFDRRALVEDLEAWVDAFGAPDCGLVGHSTGGLNAWVAAGRRPERYRALVIVDFGASLGWTGAVDGWRQWLGSWPAPFPSLGAVRDEFARLRPSHGRHFVEFFREADDGWRPSFVPEAVFLTVEGNNARAWWDELAQVRCPALLVRGAEGDLSLAEAQKMADTLPQGRLVSVEGAAHVVHEDQLEAFLEVVVGFWEEAGLRPSKT